MSAVTLRHPEFILLSARGYLDPTQKLGCEVVAARLGFLRAKHPPRKSQVGEMHCKAKAIRIPASLPYQAHILN